MEYINYGGMNVPFDFTLKQLEDSFAKRTVPYPDEGKVIQAFKDAAAKKIADAKALVKKLAKEKALAKKLAEEKALAQKLADDALIAAGGDIPMKVG